MPINIWWSTIAWPWLKENWLYVVFFPLGLLVLSRHLFGGPRLDVVSTELSEADEVKRDALSEKHEDEAKASKERDDRVAEASKDHETAVYEVIKEQKRRAEKPRTGDDLADFLKGVGKDVRN